LAAAWLDLQVLHHHLWPRQRATMASLAKSPMVTRHRLLTAVACFNLRNQIRLIHRKNVDVVAENSFVLQEFYWRGLLCGRAYVACVPDFDFCHWKICCW
jgi:hypothetical protein